MPRTLAIRLEGKTSILEIQNIIAVEAKNLRQKESELHAKNKELENLLNPVMHIVDRVNFQRHEQQEAFIQSIRKRLLPSIIGKYQANVDGQSKMALTSKPFRK